MTFMTFEGSNYDAIPITLYDFEVSGKHWRYCAADTNVMNHEYLDGSWQDVEYDAIAISDSGATMSGDSTTDDFTVSMPSNINFIQFWRNSPSADTMFLTIRKKNRGDIDCPVYWIGEVRSVKGSSNIAEYQVICTTLSSSFQRNGLRLAYGRGCPHALYDRECRVNPADHVIVATVTGVYGTRFTASWSPGVYDGFFAGGFAQWDREFGVTERVMIERHQGQDIYVFGVLESLDVGQEILMYPGCNRTTSDCNDKFNNINNYGGFPYLPGKSPFSNDPVF